MRTSSGPGDVAAGAEAAELTGCVDKLRRVASANAIVVLGDTIEDQPRLVAHLRSLTRLGAAEIIAPSSIRR